jgi:hypothetical protein
MGYYRRSRRPEPVKQPVTPQQHAAATLRAVKALGERYGDERMRDVMRVAVARALDAGLSATDVEVVIGRPVSPA